MKSIRQFCAVVGVVTFTLGSIPPVHGSSISQTIALERYTITNNLLQYDYGNLLDTGKFKVLLSDVQSTFGIPLETFEPISGRPIMGRYYYDGYKAAGVIPNWVRSRDDFYIGILPYVIVSVKGGLDPNPIPVITTQPQSQRELVGDTAYFYVDASPASYLSYQWLFKNKPLAGQTDSWLFMNNVTAANAGLYSVSVNAGGKSVVSKSALLQIVKPVIVTTQPKSQTIKTGKSAVFRVAVSGTGPFYYQWYYNAQIITNATKSFYSIPKVQPGNAGNYVVVVDNGLSFDVSNKAMLTVIP